MEKRSWWDSVLCTDTLALFRSELLFRLMELLELEDGKLALGSLGMSDGFRLITDGAVAQSEPGDWKMLAIWATFDEAGATEWRILSNCLLLLSLSERIKIKSSRD